MLVVTQANYISILPLVLALFSILPLVHMLAVMQAQLCYYSTHGSWSVSGKSATSEAYHHSPLQLSPCPQGEMREIVIEYCSRVPKSLPMGVNLSIGLEHPNHAGYYLFPAELPAQPPVQPASPSQHSADWNVYTGLQRPFCLT